MARLKYHRLWLTIGFALVSLVIWLSIGIDEEPYNEERKIFLYLTTDKYEHFLAYGVLMLWFGQLWKSWRIWLLIASSFLLMGVGLELLQGLSEYRESSLSDMVANSLGVAIGLLLMSTPLRYGPRISDSRLSVFCSL